MEVDFSTLFGRKRNTSKNIAKSELLRGEKQVAATANASKKIAISKVNDSEYAVIDSLLDSKTKANKVYRGFYLDEEVIKIIDKVDKRKKSELVNEALKIVFKNRGLL